MRYLHELYQRSFFVTESSFYFAWPDDPSAIGLGGGSCNVDTFSAGTNDWWLV